MDPFDLSNSDGVHLSKALRIFAERLTQAGLHPIQFYSQLAGQTLLANKFGPQEGEPKSVAALIAEGGVEIPFSGIDRLSRYGACSVFLTFAESVDRNSQEIIRKAFRRFYLSVLVNTRTRFRDNAIQECLSVDEPSGLAKRVRVLTKQWMNPEGVSVFFVDRSNTFLQLQNATNYDAHAEKGLRVWGDEINFVLNCYKESKPLFFHGGAPEIPNLRTFPEKPYPIRNQYFLPIRLQNHGTAHERTLGVLRMTNCQTFTKSEAALAHIRSLTWEDHFLLDFMMENYFVYLSSLMNVERSRRRFDRATHAIDLASDASLHMARNIKQELFDELSGTHQIELSDTESAVTRAPKTPDFALVRNYVLSLEAYLEDLNEQVLLNTGLEGHITGPLDRSLQIENFINETIRPLARMAPRVALLHQKRVPVISRIDVAVKTALDQAKLTKVPRVYGLPKHIQCVFRNLLDNSIKYSPRSDAAIDITFRFERDFAYVNFADDGTTIPEHELPQLFNEGFRGRKAKRSSNRGMGIGLSASKEILQYYEGGIRHIPAQRGTTFEVKLRIAGGRWT